MKSVLRIFRQTIRCSAQLRRHKDLDRQFTPEMMCQVFRNIHDHQNAALRIKFLPSDSSCFSVPEYEMLYRTCGYSGNPNYVRRLCSYRR